MPTKSRVTRNLSEQVDDSTVRVSGNASSRDGKMPDANGNGQVVSSASKSRNSRQSKLGKQSGSSSIVPDVFQDMLAEVLSPPKAEEAERPRKRRRTMQPTSASVNNPASDDETSNRSVVDDDVSIEFEDVVTFKREQTTYNDSDDASSDNDAAWEEVGAADYSLKPGDSGDDDGDLDLTLAAETSQRRKSASTRRKVTSKAERALHLDVHKMHILCLLSHVDRRNKWCNDTEIHATLKPLLSKQMLECLHPKESYTQFGRSESVKKGLMLVSKMWETKFSIIARGIGRAYWAESEREIQSFKLPYDADTLHEMAEFRAAAKSLKGSRDTGAQLFCALLRSTGLDVRLVCSLQPLPYSPSVKNYAPKLVRSSLIVPELSTPEGSGEDELMNVQNQEQPSTSGAASSSIPFSARRRLGHPNAADYFMPQISSPPRKTPKPKRKPIRESSYPVFWVEVLEDAHQKWIPVNPVDPDTVNKTRLFEPPASEPENNMSYVVAFEDDGVARDVTRRYTKAFNAKTRKTRVESTVGGERWWRKTTRFYSRRWASDLDQIEDTELAAAEAREPMPKSVADFKDHPIYALERHLRRNEVLVNPRTVGRVAAGRDAGGGKKLESVFRRSDVKSVKSADGWYRIGREVKVGEQPVKIVAPRNRGDDMEEEGETAGTALYTEEQTELYEAPPVVNGRVPKNSYGNLDVYVSSMIPKGGVHILYADASQAARLLGIDYADAVTGFEFRGRHGTAVVKGIVAATGYKDAIEAVIEGFRDEHAQAEEQMRSLTALRMWRKFMVGLRIKERVDGYEIEGEEADFEPREDDSGMQSEEYVDDGGGGFFPE